MATYVPKIVAPLLNYVPTPFVEDITSYASKAMRLKIIADRNFRGFEKASVKGTRGDYEFERTAAQGGGPKESRTILNNRRTSGNINGEEYLFEPANTKKAGTPLIDSISIVDVDAVDNSVYSDRYYSYLTLPFVPRELNYNPESNFVGIASFGRNNPFYQFTGSEDTLTFDIDWFSKMNNREDVISNCRWVEALTKGDGYKDIPHRVQLVWGADNKLFSNSIWLVTSAPYRLSQFIKGYRASTGELVNTNMMPQSALQTITLKRITETNRTSEQIIGKRPGDPGSQRIKSPRYF